MQLQLHGMRRLQRLRRRLRPRRRKWKQKVDLQHRQVVLQVEPPLHRQVQLPLEVPRPQAQPMLMRQWSPCRPVRRGFLRRLSQEAPRPCPCGLKIRLQLPQPAAQLGAQLPLLQAQPLPLPLAGSLWWALSVAL